MARRTLLFLVCGLACANLVGFGLAHGLPEPAEQGDQEPSRLVGTYRSLVPPYHQGLIAAAFGQNDRALACFAEAIRREPHNSTVYLLRALVYQKIVYFDQALADCTKALQLDSDQAVAYGFRGLTYFKKCDFDHAIADFTEALRLSPRHPGNLAYRGLCYFGKGDSAEAIRDFTAALELNPLNARVHAARALAYLARRDLTRAIDDLKAAQECEPSNAEYPTTLGGVYLITGRPDEAVVAFTAAIQVDPRHAPAFSGRAGARAEAGQYASAIADYSEALRLDTGDVNANSNLARLFATCPDANLRDGRRAVQLGRRACELTDWRDAFPISSLAAAFAETGQFDEAVRLEKKALDLAPVNQKEQFRSRLKRYQAGKPSRDSKSSEADEQ